MKTNNETYNYLFGPGGCLTRETIARHIDKLLSDEEVKRVKKHSSKCDLCEDALEGSIHFKSGNYFNQKVSAMSFSGRYKIRDSRIKNFRIFYRFAAAAASIVLLFGIYYISRFSQLIEQQTELAQQTISEENKNVAQVLSSNTDEPVQESMPVMTVASSNEGLEQAVEPSQITTKKVIEEADLIIEEVDESKPVKISPQEINISEQVKDADAGYFFNKQQDVQSATELKSAEPQLQYRVETEKSKSVRKRNSQQTKREEKSDAQAAYYVAEVLPMFRGGGVDKFEKYIADSLKVVLPDSVLKQSIVVSFSINTSGNVQDVKLIRGTDSQILNLEVIHMIENSPEWIPAYMSGKPVQTQQQVELVFKK